jgi:hypothetical protein
MLVHRFLGRLISMVKVLGGNGLNCKSRYAFYAVLFMKHLRRRFRRPLIGMDWLTFGVFWRGGMRPLVNTNGWGASGCDLADVSLLAIHG